MASLPILRLKSQNYWRRRDSWANAYCIPPGFHHISFMYPERTKIMSLNQNPLYAAPDDWRAYSGVLSRRVFAFLLDYIIIALLCIPAAIILFFLSIVTLGLGFFLYPALYVIVAGIYFGLTVGGPGQASLGMRAMGVSMMRVDGQRIDFLTAIVHLALFWILNSVLTPLVLLVGLFTERSRLLHDLLIGTVTVRAL
jgi:uncharacterized RDD family membrane protein YckC